MIAEAITKKEPRLPKKHHVINAKNNINYALSDRKKAKQLFILY